RTHRLGLRIYFAPSHQRVADFDVGRLQRFGRIPAIPRAATSTFAATCATPLRRGGRPAVLPGRLAMVQPVLAKFAPPPAVRPEPVRKCLPSRKLIDRTILLQRLRPSSQTPSAE